MANSGPCLKRCVSSSTASLHVESTHSDKSVPTSNRGVSITTGRLYMGDAVGRFRDDVERRRGRAWTIVDMTGLRCNFGANALAACICPAKTHLGFSRKSLKTFDHLRVLAVS